jgi:hypothetical protein
LRRLIFELDRSQYSESHARDLSPRCEPQAHCSNRPSIGTRPKGRGTMLAPPPTYGAGGQTRSTSLIKLYSKVKLGKESRPASSHNNRTHQEPSLSKKPRNPLPLMDLEHPRATRWHLDTPMGVVSRLGLSVSDSTYHSFARVSNPESRLVHA